jgi:HD-GYP domain-containing protein (c-di-GMP phosphodiesterase class II)
LRKREKEMSPAADERSQQTGEICIAAWQLRPGVHVRLPVPWTEHPFLFNSFVIEDAEQARLIAALQLPQLFCDPTRCKTPPRSSAADPAIAAAEKTQAAELAALAAARLAEKHARAQVMNRFRERLDKAQQHYLGAARTVGGAIKGFSVNPHAAIQQIFEVSEQSTTALLADPDSAIVLIAEKARDEGQAAHSLSVMTLSLLLGRQARLPEQALRALGIGALLHDIGKQLISPSILRNSERNRHEEAIYQTHCRGGFEAATRAGKLAQPMLDAILYHHERCDGSGFPERLSGNAIPLAARVVAIADRFDKLVNPLDSRRALSPFEALAWLWGKEQKAFDALLLQLFVRAMGVYPPGSIVQLSDGGVGAVLSGAPAGKPLCPQVIVYAPEVPRRQAIIIDLANDDQLSIARSLRLQDRPAEELDYLLPRRKLSWSWLAEQP